MNYFLTLILFTSFATKAQSYDVLVIGNYEPICIQSDSVLFYHFSHELPDTLNYFDALLIFSGIQSQLNSASIDSIISFVHSGKGVYCGAENEPFLLDFNQLSHRLFEQEAWGNFTTTEATISKKSILQNTDNMQIFAGETTVAVPFNSHVKVEAWLDDQPIITSYKIGNGMIVFDGGYSRFYCGYFSENQAIFNSILGALLVK